MPTPEASASNNAYRYNVDVSRHVAALDGLRGCALLMVLYFHTSSSTTGPLLWRILPDMGWTGVDLFFVLSGYLITNILLSSRNSTTYYTTFYKRRVLRIAPVYYLALVVILLIEPAVHEHMHPGTVQTGYPWKQQIWYWLNLSNFRSALYPLEIPLASVYWSLAIEEQFYAFWPAMVRRLSERNLAILCGAGMVASPFLRSLPIVQHYTSIHGSFIARGTPFRLDGLFAGALVALFLRSRPRPQLVGIAASLAFFTGMTMLLIASHALTQPDTIVMSKWGFTALALLFAAVVCLCVSPVGVIGSFVSRFFSMFLLRRFGKYSYFIYVTHVTLFYVSGHFLARATQSLGPLTGVARLFLALLECYVAGAISWRFLEQPILRFKTKFPYRFRPTPSLTAEETASTL